MYFAFLDEAGQPNVGKSGTSRFFTLASLMVHDSNLLPMEERLENAKLDYFLSPELEVKSNSKYSKLSLTQSSYFELREKIYEIINAVSSSIIASVIDKRKASKRITSTIITIFISKPFFSLWSEPIDLFKKKEPMNQLFLSLTAGKVTEIKRSINKFN